MLSIPINAATPAATRDAFNNFGFMYASPTVKADTSDTD
jgi:hypothetical protein